MTSTLVGARWFANPRRHRVQCPNIMLGKSPARDQEIAVCCNVIKLCAAVGIPSVKCKPTRSATPRGRLTQTLLPTDNLTILGVVSTGRFPWRGGSNVRKFNYQDALKQNLPPTIAGTVSADTMWERIAYFIQRVVPVAEQYKVRSHHTPSEPSRRLEPLTIEMLGPYGVPPPRPRHAGPVQGRGAARTLLAGRPAEAARPSPLAVPRTQL